MESSSPSSAACPTPASPQSSSLTRTVPAQRELIVRSLPLSFPLLGIAWSPDGKTIAVSGDHADSCAGRSSWSTSRPAPNAAADSGVALGVAPRMAARRHRAAGQRAGIGRRVVHQIFLVGYPSGEPRRLTNDLSSYSGLGVSPDGKSFVTIRNERRAAIWTMPRAGEKAADYHRSVRR